jgi:hypothetical protein
MIWSLAFIALADAGSFKPICTPVELAQDLQISSDNREDFVGFGDRQIRGCNPVQLEHLILLSF